MSKSYVFIQHLRSKKDLKFSSMFFNGDVEAKAYVQKLLDSSIDVESVEFYELRGHAKKVTNTVWN